MFTSYKFHQKPGEPAAQQIEPQPDSEELTQSGHQLLFKQGLAMTHERRSLVFETQPQQILCQLKFI